MSEPHVPELFAGLLAARNYAKVADLPAATAEERYWRGVARAKIGRDAAAREDLEACRDEVGAASEIELAFLDIRDRASISRARDTAARWAEDPHLSALLRAKARHALGLAEGKLRRSKAAIRELQAALALYRIAGSAEANAEVRDTLGSVFAAAGQLDIALSY